MPPHSRAGLAADLSRLGVGPGMALIVHASLSAIGFVAGGAESVIRALMDVLGSDGTLVMPSFSGQLTDPATWQAPPVPAAWHDAIRAAMPPFDPRRTPSRGMGAVAEQFRTWPGVHRSGHPVLSLAAWGRHAAALTADHPLAWALGDGTPMGRFNALGGHVLLIGVGHDRNSSLHLAETRARHRRVQCRATPVLRDGRTEWESHPDVAADYGVLFPRLGAAFEATGAVRHGPVGDAPSRLMHQTALVDFAAAWLDDALAPPADQPS